MIIKWFAEIPSIRIWARRAQGRSNGARANHVQREAPREAADRGLRGALHLYLLQLHCLVALLRQYAPFRSRSSYR